MQSLSIMYLLQIVEIAIFAITFIYSTHSYIITSRCVAYCRNSCNPLTCNEDQVLIRVNCTCCPECFSRIGNEI